MARFIDLDLHVRLDIYNRARLVHLKEKYGLYALVESAKHGKLQDVKRLMEGRRLMHRIVNEAMYDAAGHGHLDVVQALMHEYKRCGNVDDMMDSAVRGGRADVVQAMLQLGASANGGRVLARAAGLGQLAIATMLLNAGADVHARREEALRFAAAEGRVRVVRALVAAGADVHAVDNDVLRLAITHYRPITAWELLPLDAKVAWIAWLLILIIACVRVALLHVL